MPLWRLHYHLVWATKDRQPLIGEQEEQTIRGCVAETGNRMGLIVHAIGVMPDHIHISISIPPKHAVSEVVRAVKGSASRFINLELSAEASRFSWQTEFGALSFSDRGLEGVIEYVSRQRERHAANDLYPTLEMCGERDRTSGPLGTKGPS